ncbi:MAG TPA: DUF6152 family protein [Candidatus Acidoferrum sp.]|nr:DUF6152 family protein [Candidatus Acidoferrum sp.]
MIRQTIYIISAIALLAGTSVADAHHSLALFDLSRSLWIKGTVVRYQHRDPHAMITLEEHKPDGTIQRWEIEGPRLGRIELLGVDEHFIQVGEVLEFCAFYLRDEELGRRLSPDPTAKEVHFVHGQVLVKPDGKKWMWGPYGQLDKCVPRDQWGTILHGKAPLPNQ